MHIQMWWTTVNICSPHDLVQLFTCFLISVTEHWWRVVPVDDAVRYHQNDEREARTGDQNLQQSSHNSKRVRRLIHSLPVASVGEHLLEKHLLWMECVCVRVRTLGIQFSSLHLIVDLKWKCFDTLETDLMVEWTKFSLLLQSLLGFLFSNK